MPFRTKGTLGIWDPTIGNQISKNQVCGLPMWNEAPQFHSQDFELFRSQAARDQSSISNMSLGFNVSDFFAVSRLLVRLGEDYASAPAEGQELANDLKVLQDCVESLRKSSEHFSADENVRLAERMAPLGELLKEMEKLSEKYSSLTESEPRVWDRVRFPKLKVQAIHKRINLHMTTLNLFMGIRSTTSLGNIEDVLEKFAKNNPGGAFLRSDENWSRSLLPELQQRGVALDSAERCRTFIEEHLVALSEVEVANSQLMENYEGSIAPEDAIEEQIVVGGPTPDHTFSCICPGALKLQKGDFSGIKQSQSLFYRHFGGHKYEVTCKHCKFYGYQDEPFRTKDGKINTPLLFCSREKGFSKHSTEYYLDVNKGKQGSPDGVFYHTVFFWKSHVVTKVAGKHDAASFECVFCPKEKSYGALMSRKGYIDHIRQRHVQKPPAADLRERFNVYIDTQPALFKTDEGRCAGKKFDILLPRAIGRTDIIRAEQTKRAAEEARAEEERKKAEEERKKAEDKRLAAEKVAAEKQKKADDAQWALQLRNAKPNIIDAPIDAQTQAQDAIMSTFRGVAQRQRQLEQKRQPKLLPPSSIPRPLAWRESQEKLNLTNNNSHNSLALATAAGPKSILKNRSEASKAVHFKLDEDNNPGIEEVEIPEEEYADAEQVNETWEETLARLDAEEREREESQPVLSLVKTTYTPAISSSAAKRDGKRVGGRGLIVEVADDEVGERADKVAPLRDERSPMGKRLALLDDGPGSVENRIRMLRRGEVGMGDLDSAVDVSGA